ncbi:phage tail protein [Proteus sp. FZP2095]|uniref:phage tail protein n=1 Tax=Proteus sp. FZP2095 TaxID=2950158 RepID=UPI0020346E03|nr:phage tail protein [Proteus sp. FZP2095]MCM2366623.1 phage tail protein [Proteus sp. FZP2095]
MSVIKKPDLKIFAQDAKTGEIETFPDVLRGWGITLERTAGKPPLEWFNAIGKRVDEWLMYLTQRGLAEWDSTVDYPKDALVQHSSVFYVALKTTKGEQPNTSQSAWKPLVDFLGVNNKLDKTAIVQSTGTSTTSVMSQKASSDAFQPKGNYADKSSTNNQAFSGAVESKYITATDGSERQLGLRARADDDRCFISNKKGSQFYEITVPDRTGTMALIGDLYSKTECDAKFQPKGNYQSIGYSYSKSESDSKYQQKGDYSIKGDSYTKAESDAKYQAKGSYQAEGYSYSKSDSDSKFQPKGNYADKSSTNNQAFSGAVESKYITATDGSERQLGLRARADDDRCFISNKKGSQFYEITVPDRTGTMALIGDIENSELVPHPIPWSLPTAPSGYLICQGQTFNKATYPKLAIAYPSGRLPELRSEFIRGADAGRGIDTGREVLSSQSGNSLLSARGVGGNSEFSLKMSSGSIGTDNQGQREIYQQIEDQNGNETRPRNIAFLYIVRAA